MRAAALAFLAISAAWAQDASVLTITASREVNSVPDRVSLSVQVITNLRATIDQVLGYLQPAKITAADLSSVFSLPQGASPGLQWIFRPTVAISDLPAWMAALRTADLNSLAMISYFVQGTSVSQEAQASGCPYPAVLNDARAQASKLAAAAGLKVGPLVSIADGAYPQTSGVVYAAFLVSAWFAPAPNLLPAIISPSAGCTLTVQFQLLQ